MKFGLLLGCSLVMVFALGCSGGGQAAAPGPTPAPTPTPTPSPSPNPQANCGAAAQSHQAIAYVSSRALDGSDNVGSAFNLWSIKSDCTGNTPLTTLAVATVANFTSAAWSPDGTRLAYLSDRALDGSDSVIPEPTPCMSIPELTWNLWVMNADGSGNQPLTSGHCNSIQAAAWSPDGTKIAFVSSANLDGSDQSDRNAILNAPTNIWVMNSDGSGATPLTRLTLTANNSPSRIAPSSTEPMWSPDGSKIVYTSFRALDGSDATTDFLSSNIWVANADGSGSTPLTQLDSFSGDVGANRCVEARWSPDGTKIAFSCARPFDDGSTNPAGGTSVWIMNADGSGAAALTSTITAGTDWRATQPTWSPDGSKIAFIVVFNELNIWTMNPDGSSATNITQFTGLCQTHCFIGVVGGVSWSPDGSQFSFISEHPVRANESQIKNVWVAASDGSSGSNPTALTVLTTGEIAFPQWKP